MVVVGRGGWLRALRRADGGGAFLAGIVGSLYVLRSLAAGRGARGCLVSLSDVLHAMRHGNVERARDLARFLSQTAGFSGPQCLRPEHADLIARGFAPVGRAGGVLGWVKVEPAVAS